MVPLLRRNALSSKVFTVNVRYITIAVIVRSPTVSSPGAGVWDTVSLGRRPGSRALSDALRSSDAATPIGASLQGLFAQLVTGAFVPMRSTRHQRGRFN